MLIMSMILQMKDWISQSYKKIQCSIVTMSKQPATQGVPNECSPLIVALAKLLKRSKCTFSGFYFFPICNHFLFCGTSAPLQFLFLLVCTETAEHPAAKIWKDNIADSAQTEYCPTFPCVCVCVSVTGVKSQVFSIIWLFRPWEPFALTNSITRTNLTTQVTLTTMDHLDHLYS